MKIEYLPSFINFLFVFEISGFIATGYLFALNKELIGGIIFIITFCLAMYVGERIRELGKRDKEILKEEKESEVTAENYYGS